MGIFNLFKKKEDDQDLNEIKKYAISDADREASLKVRREKGAIKRMKQMQEAKIETIKTEIELAGLHAELKELKGEDSSEDNAIIKLAEQKLAQLFMGTETPGQTPFQMPGDPQTNLTNFDQDFNKNMSELYPAEKPEILQEEPQELLTRFSDDQIKSMLPKLLNKEQIKHFKSLNEDEIYQVWCVMQEDKSL